MYFKTYDFGFGSNPIFSCPIEAENGFIYYHALINFDGKVFKCTSNDFGEKNCVGVLDDNGKINWKEDKLSKRFASSHFENDNCLKCNLLPLCWGPCSQKALDYKDAVNKVFSNICTMKASEVNLNSFLITEAKNRKLIKQ